MHGLQMWHHGGEWSRDGALCADVASWRRMEARRCIVCRCGIMEENGSKAVHCLQVWRHRVRCSTSLCSLHDGNSCIDTERQLTQRDSCFKLGMCREREQVISKEIPENEVFLGENCNRQDTF